MLILLVGYLLPNETISPISVNKISYWDKNSFWKYPWGGSGIHKGIDIFCESKTEIVSPVNGVVFKTGFGTIAGNYIYILGPKWRTYYFAHLDTITVKEGEFVRLGKKLGNVGNTGNAFGKPSHLHFVISTIIPYPWLYDSKVKGSLLKMFYINPEKVLQ